MRERGESASVQGLLIYFVYTSGQVRDGPFTLGAVFRVQNSTRPRGLTCRYGVAFMVYETKHYVVTV